MKVPKGQILWVTVYDEKHREKWAITSDIARTKYNLYDLSKDSPVKVKTGKSPKDFEEEIGQI